MVSMKEKLIALLLCTIIAMSGYANFTINSNADTPDQTPGDNICADVNGNCTLRAALQEANNCSSACVINFTPNFNSTIVLTSNLPSINTSTLLIITGGALGNVTIDGNMTYYAFTTGFSSNVQLTALDIQNTSGVMSPVLNNLGGNVTISNCTINNAFSFNFGSAIRNDGTLTIERSTISNNSTPSFLGGGAISSSGTLIINQSTVSGNSAPQRGGAIYNNDGDLTITNSTLYNNSLSSNTLTGTTGGGGAIYSSRNANTTIINSTISGNDADGGSGGGITSLGTLMLDHCTFSGNRASTGGAVDVRGAQLTMSNTILANSLSSAGSIQDLLVSSSSNVDIINKNNLIESCGSSFSCPLAISVTGNVNYIAADPQLNDLADNGGPTLTHMPCPTSAAIDAGAITTNNADQRGEGYVTAPNTPLCRAAATLADIGAVEVQPLELYESGGTCFPITIAIKAFLGGAYNTQTSRMNMHLTNLLPTTVDGYTMQASAMSNTGTSTIVDWVSVELRCAIDDTVILAERPALLQSDGDVVDMDGYSPVDFDGVYVNSAYIVIRHRNHLGTMSASPVYFH